MNGGDLSPIQWAITPLKKFATFSGRAPRAEYWWFYLGTIIVSIPFRIIDAAAGTDQALNGVLTLVLLVPWIAVTVRRLHDTDRSAWWLLGFVAALGAFGALAVMKDFKGASNYLSYTLMIVLILAIIGMSITSLVFMAQAGTDGPNRYGADPYGGDELEEVFA
jgi:uncharacterized membrane protein YhaH (DUF805 family)